MGNCCLVETFEQEHIQINLCFSKKITLAAVPQEEQLGIGIGIGIGIGEVEVEMVGLNKAVGVQ